MSPKHEQFHGFYSCPFCGADESDIAEREAPQFEIVWARNSLGQCMELKGQHQAPFGSEALFYMEGVVECFCCGRTASLEFFRSGDWSLLQSPFQFELQLEQPEVDVSTSKWLRHPQELTLEIMWEFFRKAERCRGCELTIHPWQERVYEQVKDGDGDVDEHPVHNVNGDQDCMYALHRELNDSDYYMCDKCGIYVECTNTIDERDDPWMEDETYCRECYFADVANEGISLEKLLIRHDLPSLPSTPLNDDTLKELGYIPVDIEMYTPSSVLRMVETTPEEHLPSVFRSRTSRDWLDINLSLTHYVAIWLTLAGYDVFLQSAEPYSTGKDARCKRYFWVREPAKKLKPKGFVMPITHVRRAK